MGIHVCLTSAVYRYSIRPLPRAMSARESTTVLVHLLAHARPVSFTGGKSELTAAIWKVDRRFKVEGPANFSAGVCIYLIIELYLVFVCMRPLSLSLYV